MSIDIYFVLEPPSGRSLLMKLYRSHSTKQMDSPISSQRVFLRWNHCLGSAGFSGASASEGKFLPLLWRSAVPHPLPYPCNHKKPLTQEKCRIVFSECRAPRSQTSEIQFNIRGHQCKFQRAQQLEGDRCHLHGISMYM